MPKTKTQNPFQTKKISFFETDSEAEELKAKHKAAQNYANRILYGMQAIDDEINLNITLPAKGSYDDEDEEENYKYEEWN